MCESNESQCTRASTQARRWSDTQDTSAPNVRHVRARLQQHRLGLDFQCDAAKNDAAKNDAPYDTDTDDEDEDMPSGGPVDQPNFTVAPETVPRTSIVGARHNDTTASPAPDGDHPVHIGREAWNSVPTMCLYLCPKCGHAGTRNALSTILFKNDREQIPSPNAHGDNIVEPRQQPPLHVGNVVPGMLVMTSHFPCCGVDVSSIVEGMVSRLQ